MRTKILAMSLVLLAPMALAQTSRTYTYDVLGCVVKVTPGAGTPVCYAFDTADNRSNVAAAAGCTAVTGTGSGGGGGGNPPPIAVDDYFAIMVTAQPWVGDFAVLTNDSDPGDTMTITSVTGMGSANVTIGGGGTYLHWSGNALGSKHLTYTIKDSLNQMASAFLDIDFIDCPGGVCP